jgi:hypothetical protein
MVLMLCDTPGMMAPAATATKPAIRAYSIRSCPRVSRSMTSFLKNRDKYVIKILCVRRDLSTLDGTPYPENGLYVISVIQTARNHSSSTGPVDLRFFIIASDRRGCVDQRKLLDELHVELGHTACFGLTQPSECCKVEVSILSKSNCKEHDDPKSPMV